MNLERLCSDERLAIINHNCKLLIQERFGWTRSRTNFIDLGSLPEVKDAAVCDFADGETAPVHSMTSREKADAEAHQYEYFSETAMPGTHIFSHAGRRKAAIRAPPRQWTVWEIVAGGRGRLIGKPIR